MIPYHTIPYLHDREQYDDDEEVETDVEYKSIRFKSVTRCWLQFIADASSRSQPGVHVEGKAGQQVLAAMAGYECVLA